GPFFSFGDDELAEVSRRARIRHASQRRVPRSHIGIGQARIDLHVELLDDFDWRALRRAETAHCAGLVPRHKITHGRQLGERLGAFDRCHCQRPQLARPDISDGRDCLLGLVATKIDPAAERVRPAETFVSEVERYLKRKRSSLKPKTMVETERHLRVQSKPLHHLPLSGIDRRTIATLLAEIETASGPVARNRVRSSLSAFFSFAIGEGLIETNPVSGTRKASEGNGRDRVLSEAELRAILAALGDDEFSDIIRLLMLTGQRRTEI